VRYIEEVPRRPLHEIFDRAARSLWLSTEPDAETFLHELAHWIERGRAWRDLYGKSWGWLLWANSKALRALRNCEDIDLRGDATTVGMVRLYRIEVRVLAVVRPAFRTIDLRGPVRVLRRNFKDEYGLAGVLLGESVERDITAAAKTATSKRLAAKLRRLVLKAGA